jgi:phosphohistidine phosphatase
VIELRLLRHADAGDPEAWTRPDAERPLSEKGRRQSERLGKLLATVKDRPDVFITSPKIRAKETADLAAAPSGLPVIVDERLAGSLDVKALEQILIDAGRPSRPVLVGHDPDFSELLAELVGVADLPMKKGAYARVDLDVPIRPAAGRLRYLLPPDLVGER